MALRTKITDREWPAGRRSAASATSRVTPPATAQAIEPSTALVARAAAALSVLALCSLTACETQAQQQAARNTEINRKAAAEINRICSLPEDQREAELKKIKDQSGMVLYCGSK